MICLFSMSSIRNVNLSQEDWRVLHKQLEVEYRDILEKKKKREAMNSDSKDEQNYSSNEIIVSVFSFVLIV